MPLTRIRLLTGLALALCVLCVGADLASAATPASRGVLSISPARRNVTARPPLQLVPTLVKNTTESDIQVRVFPVLLFQNLDGSFGFNPTSRELNEAKLQLGVEPTSFDLPQGASKTLSLRWLLLPRKAKAAYLGVVIQGVPTLPGKKSVGTVLRLLSVNFFKLPGKYEITGKFTGLRGEQAGPRVLRFLPRIKNTGEIHAQPTNGHCKIVDSEHATQYRFRADFGSGVILPGYSREYPIVVRKVIPAGTYLLKCAARFGKDLLTRNLRFRLSAPNTLPTPNLRLKTVKASGEEGSAAKVHIVIRNRGSAASKAFLRVSLQTLGGERRPRTIARVRVPEGKIGGGKEKSVDVEVGKDLKVGSYAADVVLSNGKTDVDELTASFTASKSRGFFTKIWDWLGDHLAWVIALIALLALLFLFLLYRQRQRDMEDELVAARQGYVPPYATKPRRRSTPSAAAPSAEAPTSAAAAPPEPEAEPVAEAEPAAEPEAEPVAEAEPAAEPEAEPVAEAEPAPAAAPSTGEGVNLNSASVDELMTLPGVGRRAAQRIVALREEKGGITSLDDLSAIEGFHVERIKRLAGSAEI